jgi:hypothetical protein
MRYCVTSGRRADGRFRGGYRRSPALHIRPGGGLAGRGQAGRIARDHDERDVAGVVQSKCHPPLRRVAGEEQHACTVHVPRAGNGLQLARTRQAEVIRSRQNPLRPCVMVRIGGPSGATIKTPHGGGACIYTGHGSYRVDDNGLLGIDVEESCGGEPGSFFFSICALSQDLECARPSGRWPHNYRVTGEGLAVDSRVIPWAPTMAPSMPALLQALRSRIVSGQSLARAQGPSTSRNTTGLAVQCRAPRTTFLIRSGLSNLMTRQQRPDPDGLCADEVLDQYLAHAHESEAVTSNSPLGRCFSAAGKVADWATTACSVIRR